MVDIAVGFGFPSEAHGMKLALDSSLESHASLRQHDEVCSGRLPVAGVLASLSSEKITLLPSLDMLVVRCSSTYVKILPSSLCWLCFAAPMWTLASLDIARASWLAEYVTSYRVICADTRSTR